MVFGVADDGDASAVRAHHFAFGHGDCGVLRALGVDVAANGKEQRINRHLGKDRNEINCTQRYDNVRTPALRNERAARTFQLSHLSVRVDADDEQVAESARRFKVTDVPDVQDIEAAVGKDDACAMFARYRHARH